MFVRSLLLVLLLGIFACTPKEKTVEITVPSLPVYEIYHVDTVVTFLATVSDEGVKLGRAYLAKAKNNRKKNPDKAIYYYKRSLSIHPKQEVYMEFKEVLEETKNYRELDKLFRFLFANDFSGDDLPFNKPDFETYIDYVVNFTRLGNPYYYEVVWQIESLGFEKKKIREALLEDERLPFEKNSKAFRILEMNFLEDEEYQAYIKSPEYLEFFIQSFETVTDNWSITEKSVSEFNYHDYTYFGNEGSLYEPNFSSVLPCKPDSSFSYNQSCRLLLNAEVIAIIYSTDESATACPKEMRHITHYIAFYSSDYKFLKCIPIAWQNEKELVTAEINGREVVQQVYARIWEKPYIKTDFDNRVVATPYKQERTTYFDNVYLFAEIQPEMEVDTLSIIP
ncbi:MAG: hypothetical protein ACYC1Q_13925 [Bacteroidia bacterium]